MVEAIGCSEEKLLRIHVHRLGIFDHKPHLLRVLLPDALGDFACLCCKRRSAIVIPLG